MQRQELYNPKRDRGSGNIEAANVGEYKVRLRLIGLVFSFRILVSHGGYVTLCTLLPASPVAADHTNETSTKEQHGAGHWYRLNGG